MICCAASGVVSCRESNSLKGVCDGKLRDRMIEEMKLRNFSPELAHRATSELETLPTLRLAFPQPKVLSFA